MKVLKPYLEFRLNVLPTPRFVTSMGFIRASFLVWPPVGSSGKLSSSALLVALQRPLPQREASSHDVVPRHHFVVVLRTS